MSGEYSQLGQPLLNTRFIELLDDIEIKAQNGYIYFIYMPLNRDSNFESYSWYKRYSIQSLICVNISIIVLSSLGSRFYTLRDLLFGRGNLFDDIIQLTPIMISYTILFLATLSDGLMNLASRGHSINKMMQRMLVRSESSQINLANKVNKSVYIVSFAGGLSAVNSALVAILGSETLIEYITEYSPVLIGLSTIVGFAKFNSCISYRVAKSIKNFERVKSGTVNYPLDKMSIIAVSLLAFAANCFYSGSHSLRLLLRMLIGYKGDPAQNVKVNALYEQIIYGTTFATMPFSITAFVFSSCVEMLVPIREVEVRHFVLTKHKLAAVYEKHKLNHSGYYQSLRFYDRDKWLPQCLFFFCVSFTLLFVIGEMLGNTLVGFHSCNELLGHLFYTPSYEYTNNDRLWIGVVSGLLITVTSFIHWFYNMRPSKNIAKEIWARTVLKSILHSGILTGETEDLFNELSDYLNGLLDEGELNTMGVNTLLPNSIWTEEGRTRLIPVQSDNADITLSSLS